MSVPLLAAVACGGPSRPSPLPVESPVAMKPADPPPPTTPITATTPAKDYPASRREAIVDTLHGVPVPDPYRWLEDETKPEVKDWMKAQDAYTRQRLAALPGRDALAARLTEVFYYDAVGAPTHRHGRFFYSRKHKDKEKTIVYWKQGEHGAEQALLDPNTWSTDGSAGLKGWWPSWDGKYVAYNKSEHNADEATMYVLEVATGKVLADTIPGTRYGGASWTPDNHGFYYTWVPQPSDQVPVADRPGFAELRYHALGSDPARDPIIHEKTGNPQTFLDGYVSMDGHWLFVTIAHGWNSSDVYFKDLRKPQTGWTPLIAGVDANFVVDDFRDVFYVRTNDGAPRYHMFAVDPHHPARDAWKEIVPQGDATLESFSLVGGHLVLNYLRNAASQIEVRDLHGALVRPIDVPLGTASGMIGLPTEDTAYFVYGSYTEPTIIYKTSIKSGKVDEWARVKLPIDTSQFTTEQVRYPSKDGTQITMFLIHRKDAVKNGKQPTLLTGYGGFNVSETPGFSSARAVFLEHGGMIAIPNLRGGGEYGEDWHKGGMLLKKQNVFDDFIAAARWLESSGWTSRDELAIWGGSNGGLLMGAATTQAPQLFKAVVCGVPLLDMIRYTTYGDAKTWIPEYGSADDPAQFKALYAYSPYHHVVDGTSYPAVLMTTAEGDSRVDPLHARKMAAALQAASAGQEQRPILMHQEGRAGHGVGKPASKRADEGADVLTFFAWQLGGLG